jgi:hypothetical protein
VLVLLEVLGVLAGAGEDFDDPPSELLEPELPASDDEPVDDEAPVDVLDEVPRLSVL